MSLAALLATAPALPLHEAGKYVAGAYVVFVAVLLIYFGIMATKLQRMERELAELNAALDARARAVDRSSREEAGRSPAGHGRPEGRSQDSRSRTEDAGLDAPRR